MTMTAGDADEPPRRGMQYRHADGLITECVAEAQSYDDRPGYVVHYYWIAYPPRMSELPYIEERTAQSWGMHDNQNEALRQAREHVAQTGDVIN